MSSSAVLEAIEGNFWWLFRTAAEVLPAGEMHLDDAGVTWGLTGVPDAPFNGVLRTRVPAAELDARILAVRDALNARALPWSWYVGPASSPPELPERLEAAGVVHVEALPGMAAPLAGAAGPATPVALEWVRDAGALDAWSAVVAGAFDLGPGVIEPFRRLFERLGLHDRADVQHLLAREGDEPVGTGTVLYGAGVAGLYNIAVSAGRRRGGLGEAITRALMAAARDRGYETATLWSTPDGLTIYQRLGFAERARIAIHQPA
jgi:ribosomal protein S18 acetylase RimI-like enzyme